MRAAADLRAVYPALEERAAEAARLDALRRRRPSLRDIADATREYHFEGNPHLVRGLLEDLVADEGRGAG